MNYTLRNLAVAATLMMVGIVLVTSFIRGERRDLSQGKQEVTVYVATRDIPSGTAANELEKGGYLETSEMLREDAPPQAIGDLQSIAKLVSNETVYKGEVVSYTAFDKTAGLKPTAQIKGNERLFAVPIQASSDAAGLIRAGDHVDIMAGLKTENGQQVLMAMIARNVEVVETPQTLMPKGIEVEASAPEAEGDTKLYVLKGTDGEWQNVQFANANSDANGLLFGLRPAHGDTDTDVTPLFGTFTKPSGKPVAAEPGPNPAIK